MKGYINWKKEKICLIMIAIIIFIIFVNLSVAMAYIEDKKITMQIGNHFMYINYDLVVLECPPKIVDNKTVVPVRAIMEAFDCSVDWVKEEKKIYINDGSNDIYLWIGCKEAIVGGKVEFLDVAPYIEKGRTIIPLRFISENLGYDVLWIKTNKKIVISNKIENESIVTTKEHFKQIIKNALENFESNVELKFLSTGSDDFSLEIINDILAEYPNIDYGYRGAEAKISWIENDNIRSMAINIKYEKTKDEMIKMKQEAINKAKEIIDEIIVEGMSDYEKELVIHDYIIHNTRYDIENYKSRTIPGESYTDYGVLVNGVGVCEGYAKAFTRLLNIVGIKFIYVQGRAHNELHAWVMVNIDGRWRHVDITWNDPVMEDGSNYIRHDYFNIMDTVLENDHEWDRTIYPPTV